MDEFNYIKEFMLGNDNSEEAKKIIFTTFLQATIDLIINGNSSEDVSIYENILKEGYRKLKIKEDKLLTQAYAIGFINALINVQKAIERRRETPIKKDILEKKYVIEIIEWLNNENQIDLREIQNRYNLSPKKVLEVIQLMENEKIIVIKEYGDIQYARITAIGRKAYKQICELQTNKLSADESTQILIDFIDGLTNEISLQGYSAERLLQRLYSVNQKVFITQPKTVKKKIDMLFVELDTSLGTNPLRQRRSIAEIPGYSFPCRNENDVYILVTDKGDKEKDITNEGGWTYAAIKRN